MIEPPCTERYARWCERSAAQLMGSLLLDFGSLSIVGVEKTGSIIKVGVRQIGEKKECELQ